MLNIDGGPSINRGTPAAVSEISRLKLLFTFALYTAHKMKFYIKDFFSKSD